MSVPGNRWTLPPIPTPYIDCIFTEEKLSEKNVAEYLSTTLLPFGDSPLITARIFRGKILSRFVENRTKERIELVLEYEDRRNYLPGDSVGIFPQNRPDEVDRLLASLDLTSEADVSVKLRVKDGSKKKLPPYLPPETSPAYLLNHVLDIRGILKKVFLRSLAEHATDPTDRNFLLELCSKEGSAKYNEIVLEGQLTLTDLLQERPSCKPPLCLLMEHLPRLLPRAYTIASSPNADPNRIRIVFTVVATASGRPGLCTSWLKGKFERFSDLSARLSNLELNDYEKSPDQLDNRVLLYFRKANDFRCPEPSVPSIFVGPGSGIAPFLGFLEHFRIGEGGNPEKIERRLYFGCRYPSEDQICKEEVEAFLSAHVLTKYRVCFSRSPTQSDNCRYVQDLLYADRDEIYDLIENRNCKIFVCGDAARMAKDVDATIAKILREKSGITEEEAALGLKELEKCQRYLKDVWR